MDNRKVSGKTPIVSVILPTYNRAFTIRSSIESVLAQTYADFELIVVDDGSTDGTGDILKTIKDQRLKIIHSPENRGAAAARNLGIKASQADLIAFQDSDDLWAPHKLAVQVGRAYKVAVRTFDGGFEQCFRDAPPFVVQIAAIGGTGGPVVEDVIRPGRFFVHKAHRAAQSPRPSPCPAAGFRQSDGWCRSARGR